MHTQPSLLVSLFAFCLALWIAGYGLALIVGKTAGYTKHSKRLMNTTWNRHWKFFVGLIIGAILSQ